MKKLIYILLLLLPGLSWAQTTYKINNDTVIIGGTGAQTGKGFLKAKGGVSLLSGGNLSLYSTADQYTNYGRLKFYSTPSGFASSLFSGDQFYFSKEFGGTYSGTPRIIFGESLNNYINFNTPSSGIGASFLVTKLSTGISSPTSVIGSQVIDRVGFSSAGVNAAVGSSNQVFVDATNTANWNVSGTNHPGLLGFSANVNTLAGGTGTIEKGAAYFGTITSSGTKLNQGTLFDLTFGYGGGTSQINYAVGIRDAQFNAGANGTGLYLTNSDSDLPPVGYAGIVDSTGYNWRTHGLIYAKGHKIYAGKSTYDNLESYPKQRVDSLLLGYQTSLGFTPENIANKSTSTTLGTSNTLYPSQGAVKTYVDNAIAGIPTPTTPTLQSVTSSGNTTTATISAASYSATGTGGAGYLQLPTQSTVPTTPATGFVKEYFDNLGRYSYVNSAGYTRTYRIQYPGNVLAQFPYKASSILSDSTDTKNALDSKEPVITAGTTAQYWRGDKTFQTLNTTAVAEGSNLYFTQARVLATPLTGYATGTNTPITSANSLLTAFQNIQAQITANATTLATKANLSDTSKYANRAGPNTFTGINFLNSNISSGSNLSGNTFNLNATAFANNQLFQTVLINQPVVNSGSFTGGAVAALRVVGTINTQGLITTSTSTFGGVANFLGTIYTSGNAATSTSTQNGSAINAFSSSLWNGSSSVNSYNQIRSIASTTTNLAHRLSFIVNSSTSTTNTGGVESLSLFSSGGVGLGSTADPGTGNIAIGTAPATASAVSQILSRNPTTGIVEKTDLSTVIASYLRLTGSGTGAATTISIPHGLTGISSTSKVFVTAKNAASAGYSYVTTDATNVNIIYSVAPASGTNNLSYDIEIKP